MTPCCMAHLTPGEEVDLAWQSFFLTNPGVPSGLVRLCHSVVEQPTSAARVDINPVLPIDRSFWNWPSRSIYACLDAPRGCTSLDFIMHGILNKRGSSGQAPRGTQDTVSRALGRSRRPKTYGYVEHGPERKTA